MLLADDKIFQNPERNFSEIWTKSKFLCYNIVVMTEVIAFSEQIATENEISSATNTESGQAFN